MNSISIFTLALLITAAATPIGAALGRRFGLVDKPAGRRQHPGVIPRVGGIGLFLGFIISAAVIRIFAPLQNPDDALRIGGVIAGMAFVFAFGLLDDWRELSAGKQFIIQIAVALIAIGTTVFIERFTNPLNNELVVLPIWLVIPVTVFWIAGMMNTINWLDGLDGLATGVAAIAALLFGIHMRSLGQNDIALYAFALAGACLGFLPFNFSPARVFLGSAGAMVLGYALATLSILAPARVATALLVMALPIADTAWQIFDRYRHRRSIFKGDRGHLHFRLLELGWSPRLIVGFYWGFCAIFGTLSLLLASRMFKLIALGLLAAGVLAMLAFLSSRQPVEN